MSKVIDITPRLKTVNTHPTQSGGSQDQNLLNMQELKGKFQPILLKERRQVERTILSDLISGMLVLPEKGLYKVSMYDISGDGLSFSLDKHMGAFQVGEEIALRVYLNTKTYFPLHVKVKHATLDTQEEVVRHGVEYMKGTATDVALQHFVNFIISLNEGLQIDDGDMMAGPTIA
ncbi:PilZ domain-containing protein [Bdellovibrio sp. qaytius]|nr:PilZ domain-containing protein [Bdellovibrio sp. qaytius]